MQKDFQLTAAATDASVYIQDSHGKPGHTYLATEPGVHLNPEELRTVAYELIERASATQDAFDATQQPA